MADFLLVHGSCHGAWCWRDLIPTLAAQGHSARAIDLPGMGADQTPLGGITLDDCRDAVLTASTPETLIVGHSWGGYPVSAAAETAPNAMRGLIYLCAYFPIDGLSMVDRRRRAPRQPLTGAVVKSGDGLSYTLVPDQVPGLFYHDCTPEAVDYAMQNLRPQPIAPQDTPLPTGAAYDSVPKSYIQCTDDRTVPPEYQAEMTRDWPADRVHVMESSHSPFLSDPRGLAALLTQIERQF